MPLFDRLREKLQERIADLAIAFFGVLATAAAAIGEKIIPIEAIEGIGAMSWAKATLVLLLICTGLGAFALLSKPRLRFRPRLGIYQDTKSQDYYCPSCYSKKLRSPLMVQSNGWACMVKDCRLYFNNPDVKAQSEPKRRIRSSGTERI